MRLFYHVLELNFLSSHGGTKSVPLRLLSFRFDHFLRLGFAAKMLTNTKKAICQKFVQKQFEQPLLGIDLFNFDHRVKSETRS